MGWNQTLFDDNSFKAEDTDASGIDSSQIQREVPGLDRLKSLDEKITAAVERVKALKEEKILLAGKIKDLEELLNEKNQEIERLRSEKRSVGSQLEELLSELETLEI